MPFTGEGIDHFLDAKDGCLALAAVCEQLSHARGGGSQGEGAIGEAVEKDLIPQYQRWVLSIALAVTLASSAGISLQQLGALPVPTPAKQDLQDVLGLDQETIEARLEEL